MLRGKLTRAREPFAIGTELHSRNSFHMTGESEFQRVVWFLKSKKKVNKLKKRQFLENLTRAAD